MLRDARQRAAEQDEPADAVLHERIGKG